MYQGVSSIIETLMELKFGQINNYAGTVVSLNQKKATYIGIGETKGEHGQMKVWLTPQKWCTKLPSNLTAEDTRQIQAMLDSGILVEGKHYLPVAKKDLAVLKEFLNLTKSTRYLNDAAKEPFRELFRAKQKGNYSAFEIFNECLKLETNTQNRAEWIAFFNDAIKSFDGPKILVEDYEHDPEIYTITIDEPSRPSTSDNSQDKKKTKEKAKAQEPEVSPEKKEELLKKFLG